MKTSSRISGPNDASGGVEAVNRALAVLRCFTDAEPVLTLTRIAEVTGFYKSSVLRLAASLEAGGMLVRREDKSYALGHETLRLSHAFQRSFRLEEYVRPVLQDLVLVTGESASFFRREGDGRLCLFREESRHSVRDVIHEGAMLSLHRGAAGHVLRRFANGPTRPLGDLPVLSRGERDAETAALAVPVFGSGAALVGALSISGPISRLDTARVAAIASPLRQAGKALSEELGGGAAWE
jgi:DNA-binding IclR family transcriptional regulator